MSCNTVSDLQLMALHSIVKVISIDPSVCLSVSHQHSFKRAFHAILGACDRIARGDTTSPDTSRPTKPFIIDQQLQRPLHSSQPIVSGADLPFL